MILRLAWRSSLYALTALPLFVYSASALGQADAAKVDDASEVSSGSTAPTRAQREARDAYIAGARALDHDNLDAAQASFALAARLDPENRDYRVGEQLALEHRVTALVQQASRASDAGNPARAKALLAEATKLDPQNEVVAQHNGPQLAAPLFNPVPVESANPAESALEASASIGGEMRLATTAGMRSFHVHADVRSVVTQVFAAWGLHTVFDDSVAPQDLRFEVNGVSFAQAAPLVLQMGRLYAVPLDRATVLVAKDSTEVRTRLERQLEETIYVPGYGTEQLNELGNVLRNVFDVRQLSVQGTSGKLLVRAPAETIHAVNLTLADLIDGGSEISMDLRLYAVDKSRTRNIGPQLPQQFGLYNVASAAQSLVSANQSVIDQAIAQGAITLTGNPITDLVTEAVFLISSGLAQSSLITDTLGFFGKGLTFTGVTAGPATLNLALNSSDSRELDKVQLRVSDRQPATFRAGTRYPITTATYATGLSATSSSALAGVSINGVSAASLLNQYLGSGSGATIPQIQYEDLGLTLKATPQAQKSGEVSMHLDLRIEALSGTTLNNIPVLASRQFVSDITVADGQTAVMVSTLSKQESVAISGIPGLGELPGFQSLTADRIGAQDVGELVLLITPHVVRRRSNAVAGPRIAFSPAPDQRD